MDMTDEGLNILVVSNSPYQFSGYGTTIKNLLPKLQEKTEHNFTIYAMSGLSNSRPVDFKGIDIYGTTKRDKYGFIDINPLAKMIDADFIMFFMDAWIYANDIDKLNTPYGLYMPVDSIPLANACKKMIAKSYMTVPMCNWAKDVIEEAGLEVQDPIYHAIDEDEFFKKEVSKESFNVSEDKFIFSVVKNNQGMRANYDKIMEGFSIFVEGNDADDAVLYIHAHPQPRSSGFDLAYLAKIKGIGKQVLFTPTQLYNWGVDEEMMASMYNITDVLINTTRAEGFGYPIIEAMACGTPVIGTDFSSMTEIIGEDEERGWLVDFDQYEFTMKRHDKWALPSPDDIAEKLAEAYNNKDQIEKKGNKGFLFAHEHDWDTIANEWAKRLNNIDDTGHGGLYQERRENGIDKTEFKEIREHIQKGAEDILEIGSGTGVLASDLEESGYNMVATDISQYAVDKCDKRGVEAHKVSVFDLEEYFRESDFDCVIAQHLLEEFGEEKDKEILEQAIRFTKPGGRVLFIVPSTSHINTGAAKEDYHYYSAEDMNRLAKFVHDEINEDHVFNYFPEGDLDIFIEIKVREEEG